MPGEFYKTYQSSFGGCDITAIFGKEVIGTIQAISYSITREKGPIYTMRGSADPIAFARGKRAAAGNLVFLVIDRDPILNHFANSASEGSAVSETGTGKGAGLYNSNKFYASKNDFHFGYNENLASQGSDASNVSDLFGVQYNDAEGDFKAAAPGSERELKSAWYSDQLPPFDVNISAANEMGGVSKKSILGVELMNEGSGFSIDDLVIESQYTFLCRSILPWTPVQNEGSSSWGSSDYASK